MLLVKNSFRAAIVSSCVLALASLGDAFLYIGLPLQAIQLNVPIEWVGILLSVNRFIRLFANVVFVLVFQYFDLRTIAILGAVFAVVTTYIYSIANFLLLWIAARIVWGLCFSALRMITITYSLYSPRQGFSLGINRGIQETGPIIALLLGPIIMEATDVRNTFLIFSLLGLAGIAAGFFLPKQGIAAEPPIWKVSHLPGSIELVPSSVNQMAFMTAFLVQGVLVVSVPALLSQEVSTLAEVASLAGFFLAFRRICSVIVSPIGGLLSERFGIARVNLASILLTALGCVFVAYDFVAFGLLVAFASSSVTGALSPGHNAKKATNQIQAVASNNTWSDLGAAIGILTGGVSLFAQSISVLLLGGALVLLGLTIFYVGRIYAAKLGQ